jgi:MarR family transcriptional regulator, organic hydroperoxide resistance regulator
MVNFACKKISKEEIIRCSFGLNKSAYNLLYFLFKQKKPLDINTIFEKMNLERSSVQKAIPSLIEKDLISRKQKNISSGGYLYFYFTKDKEEIKRKIKELVGGWYENITKEIENI